MESAGLRLKKVRLEKGLTLEDVHKKTKIHLNILKAIEEDSLVGINPIYVKGFLKIYCRFLGVEPKDYIEGYKEPKILSVPPEQKGKTPHRVTNYQLNLDFLKGLHKKIRIALIPVVIIFLSFGLFRIGRALFKAQRKPVANKPQRASVLPRSAVVSKKEDKAGVKKEPTAIAGIRLSMRAKEDCWVNLKIDGRVVFRNVLKKGRVESWEAKDKMEFTLNNAGAIELELNGKSIAALGRRGQAIKNIIITKEEGLVVGR